MIENVVAREVARLQSILKDGLPKCYKDFNEYLFDFFPDFSWTVDDTLQEMAALLGDERWLQLARLVKAEFGFDFEKQVQDAHDLYASDNL